MQFSYTFQQPLRILVDNSYYSRYPLRQLRRLVNISYYSRYPSLLSFLSSSFVHHFAHILGLLWNLPLSVPPLPFAHVILWQCNFSQNFLGLSKSKIENYILSTRSDHCIHQLLKLYVVFINNVGNSLAVNWHPVKPLNKKWHTFWFFSKEESLSHQTSEPLNFLFLESWSSFVWWANRWSLSKHWQHGGDVCVSKPRYPKFPLLSITN